MAVLPDEDHPFAGGTVTQASHASRTALPGTRVPGAVPSARGAWAGGGAPAGWEMRQRHSVPDNSAVLADLDNGVTSLWLVVGADAIPVLALDEVLDGVHLGLTPVILDAGAEAAPAAAELLRLYDAQGIARATVRGCLGADPLGHEARTGEVLGFGAAAYLARRCADAYPALRALTVDALPWHEAGGSAAQELGCALATGAAYLRELRQAGMNEQQASSQVEFRYAATADRYVTIAKLRAARRLWARVAGAADLAAQRQHAVSSPLMKRRRDPWVNMLGTTMAALSAGAGGAEAVTALSFEDDAPGPFGGYVRRSARNTSALLVEQSRLARVIDPAGGSWYVEKLTDELAHGAWEFFQSIEHAGGQAKALRSGMIADRLAGTVGPRAIPASSPVCK
ncbi:hypothetical protein C8250_034270 [Streptomyces sp. So13.3]|nr:hypothetical protein C8250_034270 [Streptomyces sp. So13.3]